MTAEEMEVHYEEHGKSDLTLTSQSEFFYVHQNVVCAQSAVVKGKCAALKQTPQQPSLFSKLTKILPFWHHEPKNPEIHIEGDDHAIDAMVHFFYHGDYLPDNYGADTVKFDKDAGFHLAVMMVAKAYQVKELEALAQKLMEKAFEGGAAPVEHADDPGPAEDGGIRMV